MQDPTADPRCPWVQHSPPAEHSSLLPQKHSCCWKHHRLGPSRQNIPDQPALTAGVKEEPTYAFISNFSLTNETVLLSTFNETFKTCCAPALCCDGPGRKALPWLRLWCWRLLSPPGAVSWGREVAWWNWCLKGILDFPPPCKAATLLHPGKLKRGPGTQGATCFSSWMLCFYKPVFPCFAPHLAVAPPGSLVRLGGCRGAQHMLLRPRPRLTPVAEPAALWGKTNKKTPQKTKRKVFSNLAAFLMGRWCLPARGPGLGFAAGSLTQLGLWQRLNSKERNGGRGIFFFFFWSLCKKSPWKGWRWGSVGRTACLRAKGGTGRVAVPSGASGRAFLRLHVWTPRCKDRGVSRK